MALLAAALLPAHGFAPVRPMTLSRVKSARAIPLRTPLPRLDDLLAVPASRDTEEKEIVPRGLMEIVLNACVGGLTFAGGVLGFVKKGSKASLIAGSAFGGTLVLSSYFISKNDSKGYKLGTVVSGLLTFVMRKKYVASKKFLPAGLIAGLGAIAFFYNLVETLINLGQQSEAEGRDEGE
eukprot:CAMPEP_0183309074 /NCGR_PEP_ID=MMETSP0160_2-20130417/23773_1 /TAXON_ID=2839 ORGANISM="Odontella Sinensis, Strain Grunow 1884" /NCGR_SAMPLE_ID=MMETSP0160_2 /ASSEMBLY_ACC=CAM_ASM_000250 /LENGTH=179 /DNA_ID=CAMNT_0025473023 /DNA_START=145 /DNA_END=684 /DNA_ORIENTATION=+